MSDPKSIRNSRIIAAIIDALVFFVVNVVLAFTLGLIPILGALLAGVAGALAYAMKDAIPLPALNGASPGKMAMKIKAVNMNGGNLTPEESIKRNLSLVIGSLVGAVLGTLFGILPIVGAAIGSTIGGFLQLGVTIYEFYLVWTKEDGRRWGDTFANTHVISTEGITAAASAGGFPPPPPSAVPPPPPGQASSMPPPPPAASTPPPAQQDWDEDTRH